MERYNCTLEKWEEIVDMHDVRSRGLGCAHFGGFVWALGGVDENGRALNTVERCAIMRGVARHREGLCGVARHREGLPPPP